MRMKGSPRLIALPLLGLVVGVSSGIALSATTVGNDGVAQRQRLVYTKSNSSTSSKKFKGIPGLNRSPIANRGPATLVFSGDFSGAPVEIRALKGSHGMAPGVAHFDPSTGTTSFTFVFMAGGGAPRCRDFSMVWRSPSGSPVVLHHGSFTVTYDAAKSPGSGFCE